MSHPTREQVEKAVKRLRRLPGRRILAMDAPTGGERRRGVSDTDKCPKCGKPLVWDTQPPESVPHPEEFRYQIAECSCGWTSFAGTKMAGECMVAGLLHRIRELEAKNARLREALK